MSLICKEGDENASAIRSPAEMIFHRTTKISKYIVPLSVKCFNVPCSEAGKEIVDCHAAVILDTIERD